MTDLARQHERRTGQQVGAGFIARYIAALIGLQVAVLTPSSVTLSVRVADLDPAGKTGSLAVISGIGAIAAMISNPIFGLFSDRSTCRWGNRRPYMFGGMLAGTLAVLTMGIAPNLFILGIGWCAAQIAFNATLAALMAMLPERIPEEKRGKTAGLVGLTSQVGMVGGTFLIQFTGTHGPAMFVIPCLIGLLAVGWFTRHLKEAPRQLTESASKSWRAVAGSLWINPIKHRAFGWVFLSGILFWTASSLVLTYKTYFLMDRLGYSSAGAAAVLFWTMLLLAAGIVLGSTACGFLSDRLRSRTPVVLASACVFTAAAIIIAFSYTLTGFLIGIAISGLGSGGYQGVSYALAAKTLPNEETEAGKGMGVYNITTCLPTTIAPLFAPGLLAIGDPSGQNYTALYLAAAGFAIIGAIVIIFIRSIRAETESGSRGATAQVRRAGS